VQGTTPVIYRLSTGSYTLTLKKEFHDSLQFNVTIARSEKQVIDAQTATLRRHEGVVMVSSNPFQRGAEILVDGKISGQVPTTLRLLPGT
jgi:hypothetical protein